LQPGLLDGRNEIAGLWRKAQRKPAYYVGFIVTRPDDIAEPDTTDAHPRSTGPALARRSRPPATVVAR
jgi:hypothetical protein